MPESITAEQYLVYFSISVRKLQGLFPDSLFFSKNPSNSYPDFPIITEKRPFVKEKSPKPQSSGDFLTSDSDLGDLDLDLTAQLGRFDNAVQDRLVVDDLRRRNGSGSAILGSVKEGADLPVEEVRLLLDDRDDVSVCSPATS